MKKQNKSEEPKAVRPYTNQVRLVGYLGDEPKQYENRAVMSLATKTSWKPADSDKWQDHTEWHRIVAWGKLAEAVRTLAKGDHVQVEGELRSNRFERVVEAVGGGHAAVEVKTWEIRAKSVCKLLSEEKKEQPVVA